MNDEFEKDLDENEEADFPVSGKKPKSGHLEEDFDGDIEETDHSDDDPTLDELAEEDDLDPEESFDDEDKW